MLFFSGGEQEVQYAYIVNSGQDQKYVEDLPRDKQVQYCRNRTRFVVICGTMQDLKGCMVRSMASAAF